MPRITSKGQTTVPKKIRKEMGAKPGDELEWHVVRGITIVHKRKRIKDPLKVLTSQVKADVDMVKLIREMREEMS